MDEYELGVVLLVLLEPPLNAELTELTALLTAELTELAALLTALEIPPQKEENLFEVGVEFGGMMRSMEKALRVFIRQQEISSRE